MNPLARWIVGVAITVSVAIGGGTIKYLVETSSDVSALKAQMVDVQHRLDRIDGKLDRALGYAQNIPRPEPKIPTTTLTSSAIPTER